MMLYGQSLSLIPLFVLKKSDPWNSFPNLNERKKKFTVYLKKKIFYSNDYNYLPFLNGLLTFKLLVFFFSITIRETITLRTK